MCFDAQQAVEKALKALLLHKKINFRFVHDVAELLTTLDRGGVHIPDEIRDAASLTPYAVETRYPGPFENVSPEELNEAIHTAERVLHWVEPQLNEKS
jgi:hypothetical protein